MKAYLEDLFLRRRWDEDCASAILQYNDTFLSIPSCREVLLKWTGLYEKDIHIDYLQANKEMQEAAEINSLGVYESQLLLYLYFSYHLHDHYRQAGLPMDVCEDSIDDLKWKAVECHKVYGVWGSFVAFWFPGFFDLTRFSLGRLQFEAVPFPEDYVQAGGVRPEGADYVLNVHIPSSGHLTHESCLDSYRRAVDFWDRYFGLEMFGSQTPLFLCYSWLLSPAHEDFLPQTSNILSFQRDFHVYFSEPDLDRDCIWRFFDCMYDGNIAALPEKNSLQRAYKKWLSEGNIPLNGKGILNLNKVLQ